MKDKNEQTRKRLLVIDDEENMRHVLAVLLGKYGYLVDTAPEGYQGLNMAENTQYDFILCDIKMPGMSGMDFLKAVREKPVSSTIIMMSAYGTIDTAVEAMKLGAYDYISKPFKSDEVCLTLKKAEERESLKKENLRLKEQIRKVADQYSFGNMAAESRVMKSVFYLAEKAAQYNATVLIFGESGTGKELIARGIHFGGDRAAMPFVPVNCGGIPENLLESEFFGYKKGAFTGADKNKKGLFEEAENGTVFLDEIGEMPLSLQVKLLRVLQESEIRPLGDSKTKKINIRVIAATSKTLENEVREGRFRQDLFYRLNVLPIHLPPLRERIEDIPLLVRHFIDKFNKIFQKDVKGVAPEALSLLLKAKWQGNVRELENAVERAVILSEEQILGKENFPFSQGDAENSDEIFEGYSLKSAQRLLEKKMIVKALTATRGNRTHASRLLEISHPSLLQKIKAYNISI